MANKIRLNVGGIDYIVASEDDQSYIRKLGEELNSRLDTLQRQKPFLSTTMVAVLTALDLCDEAKKAKNELETAKLEMKRYIEDAACARLEADEAKRELERLSAENARLRNQL